MDRRAFLKASVATAAAGARAVGASSDVKGGDFIDVTVDDFGRPDSFYLGDGWESMNPGYWRVQDKALRRRIDNIGESRPQTQFPWHAETHGRTLEIDADPSLPIGLIWRRDWKLSGNYTLAITGRIKALPPRPPESPEPPESKHAHHQPGYGLIGLCFGGHCLHESYEREGNHHAAKIAAWHDDGTFTLEDHGKGRFIKPVSKKTRELTPAERFAISLTISGDDAKRCTVTAQFVTISDGQKIEVRLADVNREQIAEGYFGLAARGLLDVAIDSVSVTPGQNKPLNIALNDCHVCYALGDTLRQDADGKWRCRFIAMFRSDGERAQVRISDSETPEGGWASVDTSGGGGGGGEARIINNEFRRNTAVIEAVLPANPAEATLYYTIWKDGKDVTADPRLAPGSDAVGAGTGFINQTPGDDQGQYVGRLPRLTAPYRLCGLSCHAIASNRPNLPDAGAYGAWWLNDQPTPGAYQHLRAFDFQVMLWEDDVWYLELIFAPPSTDDAYKVITTTLGGPTTRWQMMRHWNVLNPGDHDHGMDDVKGPEQILVRSHAHLGQDPAYMRRNFQIVSHLMRGDEDPSGVENPRRWRRWKMPEGDFSLLVLDSRLWRSSQDTKIWDDEGWDNKGSGLYARQDVTRSLLGEEQFAWLTQMVRTDSAPLICLTGINGLHTVWTGAKNEPDGKDFNPRDRVAADYAGWVSAGVDRVLELLGSRDGVVSVYGDVHNGCIMKNVQHRVYECSFGPIGRSGGRAPKPGFGRRMKDYDGREIEVTALYHAEFHSPELTAAQGPFYWNFLDMHFDPRPRNPRKPGNAQPAIGFAIRNLVDSPKDEPRGGGSASLSLSDTGRAITCRLPGVRTLGDADVLITTLAGEPIRGARTLGDGTLPLSGLIDIAPGTPLIVTAHAAEAAEAKMVRTLPL